MKTRAFLLGLALLMAQPALPVWGPAPGTKTPKIPPSYLPQCLDWVVALIDIANSEKPFPEDGDTDSGQVASLFGAWSMIANPEVQLSPIQIRLALLQYWLEPLVKPNILAALVREELDERNIRPERRFEALIPLVTRFHILPNQLFHYAQEIRVRLLKRLKIEGAETADPADARYIVNVIDIARIPDHDSTRVVKALEHSKNSRHADLDLILFQRLYRLIPSDEFQAQVNLTGWQRLRRKLPGG